MKQFKGQLIGTVTTPEGTAQALLCRDVDAPDFLTISVWDGPFEDTQAFRLRLYRADDEGNYHGFIENYFESDANGGLFLPTLSPEKIDALQSLRVHLKFSQDGCKGIYTAQKGEGSFEFRLDTRGKRVESIQLRDWHDFKSWAASAKREKGMTLFRGHGHSKYPLCTTFNRAGRFDLGRYVERTMPEFRRHAEAILGKRLNGTSDDFGTLLALGQHHGLPTPLLDFTLSPYIAAFFAFSDALDQERSDATHVRIFGLTQKFVEEASPSIVPVHSGRPYIKRLSVSPVDNARLYAQQGEFLVTNLHNVEQYINHVESETATNLLYAVDIPISETINALEDLKYMGVTASTMFPGLDGVCKMMRHEMLFKTRIFPPLDKDQGLSKKTTESTLSSKFSPE